MRKRFGPRLREYKRLGKELIPPLLSFFPQLEEINWWSETLPEFLWIDSLLQAYGQTAGANLLNDFLGVLDKFYEDPKFILNGLVTSFGDVPQQFRSEILVKHASDIEWAVKKPFAHVLTLYKNCPMRWLVRESAGPDSSAAIAAVRAAVVRLLPGKDDYGGFCRAIPLRRYFVHKQVLVASNLTELIDSITKYPHGDRFRVESFARSHLNGDLRNRSEEGRWSLDWVKSFWRENYSIVGCDLNE